MEIISFSKKVKEELLHTNEKTTLEADKIHLVSMLQTLGTLNYEDEKLYLELKSTNVVVIRNAIKKIKDNFDFVSIQIVVREIKRFNKKNKTYIIRLKEGTEKLLVELELANSENVGIFFKYKTPKYITKDDRTVKEYLKFFFICSGSINDPKIQKQYHLEMISEKQDILEFVLKVTQKYNIFFKITHRKTTSALYLNKGEEIADFLKLIGAINGMFEFEDYRLFRDIRATENRLINAEIANEVKKNNNAQKQIDAILKLKQIDAWNTLKTKTKLIADLRLENKEASLSELEKLTEGTISKSNIRHHLNLIMKKSEEI